VIKTTYRVLEEYALCLATLMVEHGGVVAHVGGRGYVHEMQVGEAVISTVEEVEDRLAVRNIAFVILALPVVVDEVVG